MIRTFRDKSSALVKPGAQEEQAVLVGKGKADQNRRLASFEEAVYNLQRETGECVMMRELGLHVGNGEHEVGSDKQVALAKSIDLT